MIELQNLTKSYRLTSGERRYIFRDLNFSFPDGANIGLIGRNGAGKSTLMRLIGGIDTPDHGRVVTDKRISWPVGLSGGLQGSLTGRDSVKFVCRVYGALGKDMRDKIRFVEDFAEIGAYFDQPVKSYSSGMRARLNFGLSWAFDFDYYLLDEIGAVGDARFKQKSRKLMEDRIGRSNVILVTHAMNEVARLCNVVVLVNDGEATLYEDVQAGIAAYQELADIAPQRRLRNGPGRGARPAAGGGAGRRQARAAGTTKDGND
ncbi:MAG: ABC transporter ATP-binding protein [Anderseniella sp.]|jgi:capsular polysaccharide transport system ATP-binding protein|nr:ABC transporter ATP-binding protein [Anderseniella sp.]